MKSIIFMMAASLTGCSAVTVYSLDSPPSPRCMLIAPVKYSLLIPADSPDQGTPLQQLKTRVLESCKEEARDAGANALLITDRPERDAADRKASIISCNGMAYACP